MHREIRYGVAANPSGIRHAAAPDAGMERLQPQRHSCDISDRLQNRYADSQGAPGRNPPHEDRRVAGVIDIYLQMPNGRTVVSMQKQRQTNFLIVFVGRASDKAI